MPYISERIPLKDGQKRSQKLTHEQKETIRTIRKETGRSYNSIAIEYNVSKRTIQFVCNPEALEQNKQRRNERGGSKQYYDREKSTQAIREHRRYKQDLYLNGEL